jgi:DNA-binding transcriptional LysR family regulator
MTAGHVEAGRNSLSRVMDQVVPTSRALQLQPQVAALVDQTRALVQSKAATPLHEIERTFTIRTEDSTALLTSQLYEFVARRAPKLKLRVMETSTGDMEDLREGTVHLVISATREAAPEIK